MLPGRRVLRIHMTDGRGREGCCGLALCLAHGEYRSSSPVTAQRTLFAASSGALVDWLDGDWGVFFIITALMVLPSLACPWAIRARLAGLLSAGNPRLLKKHG